MEQDQEQLPSPFRRSDTSVPGEMVELELINSFWKVKSNEDIEGSLNQDDASDSSDDGSNPLSKRGKMQSDLKNQEQRDIDMTEDLKNQLDSLDLTGNEKKENAKKGSKKDSPKLPWQVWEEEHKRWINENTLEDVKLDDQSDIMNGTAEASSDLTMPLRRYQKEWLFWALKQENSEFRGGILADEMGMGKTIQSIALVLAKRELHQMSCEPDESIPSPGSSKVVPVIKGTLVICPLAAVTTWVNEIGKFTSKGSTKVLVYHGSKRRKSVGQFSDYDFVITTYPTLGTEFKKDMSLPHAVKWQRIMLDEAHIIKSRTSNTTQAVLALESTYKWALCGTPFQNSVGELYSLVQFLQIFPYSYYLCKDCDCRTLDFPWSIDCSNCDHDSYRHFCWWDRYLTKPKQTRGNDDSRKRAMILLRHRVLKDILLRRTKSGRAADLGLPPRIVRYISQNTLMKNYAHILALISRLRQAVCHPYLVEFSETATSRDGNMDNTGTVEQVCGICKAVAEDLAVTPCGHIFCNSCLIASYLVSLSAALVQVPCPSCSQLLPADLTSTKDVKDRAKKTTIKGFGPSSILNKITLETQSGLPNWGQISTPSQERLAIPQINALALCQLG
ncbi:hypothetical protein RIF29_27420 [Crotalaria pallida]|uniref:Uncharacterized protein n=1 Tax=Crotalaria pallida TaxID=3830 RepID=A0AAN9I5K0_CROPI